MTDSETSNSVLTWSCPSPDDCNFTAGGTAELLEHVNTEHAGEYQRDDWPDTAVAQQEQYSDEDDSDESIDE
ncbi:hypothetical protein [Natrinema sp. SYSU A 869]|uniref:hypothetical protein n=1 Tax=Natrinema sp. SYSU A 869 TaxID=2871694 RepID=UPI001CA3C01C|nr:hypothetical protein [Natrinema sp. SYSU A 869]